MIIEKYLYFFSNHCNFFQSWEKSLEILIIEIHPHHPFTYPTPTHPPTPKCYPNVTWELPKCYLRVTQMLPESYPNVTWLLPGCYLRVTQTLPERPTMDVTQCLPGYYLGVTWQPNLHNWDLPDCYLHLTQSLPAASMQRLQYSGKLWVLT